MMLSNRGLDSDAREAGARQADVTYKYTSPRNNIGNQVTGVES